MGKHLSYHIKMGSRCMDRSLGIQTMPAGYHLMLDADEMFFYWLRESDGMESSSYWDKWAAYRAARLFEDSPHD